MSGFGTIRSHLLDLRSALADLERQAAEVERWGAELADLYDRRGRLLAAGNGGSAAEAQHLTAELVGRFEGERRPLSAIALHAESSSLTAIGNDYGIPEVFARQVEAHGRPGDVLLLLSTSGRSRNLLVAAERARECDLRVWALVGRPDCPLARRADRTLSVRSDSVSAIQEIHLVVVHALCAAIERHLDAVPAGIEVRRTAVADGAVY
jgi:D-sedoheptulose 7-phosphate isomerase